MGSEIFIGIREYEVWSLEVGVLSLEFEIL